MKITSKDLKKLIKSTQDDTLKHRISVTKLKDRVAINLLFYSIPYRTSKGSLFCLVLEK